MFDDEVRPGWSVAMRIKVQSRSKTSFGKLGFGEAHPRLGEPAGGDGSNVGPRLRVDRFEVGKRVSRQELAAPLVDVCRPAACMTTKAARDSN